MLWKHFRMSKSIGPQDGYWVCRPDPVSMFRQYAASLEKEKDNSVSNETYIADSDLRYMRERMEQIRQDREFARRAHELRPQAQTEEKYAKPPEELGTPKNPVPADEQQPSESDFAFINRRAREIVSQEGRNPTISGQILNNGTISAGTPVTSRLKCLNCADNGWTYHDLKNIWEECGACDNPHGFAQPGNMD